MGRQALHPPQVQRLLLRWPRLLRRKRDCTPALFLTSSATTSAMSLCTSEEEGLHTGLPPHNVGVFLGGRGIGPLPHNVGEYFGGGGTGPPPHILEDFRWASVCSAPSRSVTSGCVRCGAEGCASRSSGYESYGLDSDGASQRAERVLSVSAYGVERVYVDPPGQDTHRTDLSENGETQQATGAEWTLSDSVHGLRLMEVDPVKQMSLSCKAQTG